MRIRINVKGISRRREAVVQQVREVPDRPMTVEEFLRVIVRQEVEACNGDGEDSALLRLFGGGAGPDGETAGAEQALENMAAEGRVRYGRFPDGKKADVNKAVADALLAFDDGLAALFADGVRYEDRAAVLPLQEDSEVTFVRLTFLAGRMW